MPLGVNLYDEERLQGRNVANANAFNIVSPGIVEDGLVLHLDAGNRVSYPTSGTVWYDLTDNRNNGTLTNGPTFDLANGGSVVFDGTNDYGSVASINLSQTNNITVCCFVKIASGASDRIIIEHSADFNTNNAFLMSVDSSNRINFGSHTTSSNYNFQYTNSAYANNAWYYISGISNRTLTGTAQTSIYVNGEQAATTSSFSVNLTQNFSTFALYIGARAGTSLFTSGNVGLVQLYNRALTPAEVAQNFNATRARFGV